MHADFEHNVLLTNIKFGSNLYVRTILMVKVQEMCNVNEPGFVMNAKTKKTNN